MSTPNDISSIHFAVLFAVKLVAEQLSDEELKEVLRCLNFNENFKSLSCYNLVKSLFTENNEKMHHDTEVAFRYYSANRISENIRKNK
ncbi:MAG TPA: hypothetical protein DDY71_11115 [Spirochaetia bacterium]|nr:hypothetical protein [Spirochaetia bacterium]